MRLKEGFPAADRSHVHHFVDLEGIQFLSLHIDQAAMHANHTKRCSWCCLLAEPV